MKSIKDLHDLIDKFAGKNEASIQSPTEKDLAIYYSSLDLQEELYAQYPVNIKYNRYLDPFKKQDTLSVQAGNVTLPEDFFRERSFLTNDQRPIELLDDHQWNFAINDPVAQPSVSYPIGTIENVNDSSSLILLPSTGITEVTIKYFRKPVKQKFAFTLDGSRYVYDDENSIDIEFGEELFPKLVPKVLSQFGIEIRDEMLVRYFEGQKAQEQ